MENLRKLESNAGIEQEYTDLSDSAERYARGSCAHPLAFAGSRSSLSGGPLFSAPGPICLHPLRNRPAFRDSHRGPSSPLLSRGSQGILSSRLKVLQRDDHAVQPLLLGMKFTN